MSSHKQMINLCHRIKFIIVIADKEVPVIT